MKIVIAALALVLTACSSSEKKVDETKSALVAAPVPAVTTSEDVLQRYSIVELNSVANLMKVIIDENKNGEDIIGCPLTPKEAGTYTMPLKYLIDQQMRAETEAYTADPKNYAIEKGFETCASQCACGVLSDVVNGANESSLPRGVSSKLHPRNKQRLAQKASHQSKRESLACARKQSSFCNSDLKAYLQKEAKDNAD